MQNYMDESKNGQQISNKFAQKETEEVGDAHTHTHTVSLYTLRT